MLSPRGSSWLNDWIHIFLCLLHWQEDSLPLVPPGKPMQGIRALIKGVLESLMTSCSLGAPSEKSLTGRELSPDRAGTLISDFQPPELWAMSSCVYKSPTLSYCSLDAPTDWEKEDLESYIEGGTWGTIQKINLLGKIYYVILLTASHLLTRQVGNNYFPGSTVWTRDWKQVGICTTDNHSLERKLHTCWKVANFSLQP